MTIVVNKMNKLHQNDKFGLIIRGIYCWVFVWLAYFALLSFNTSSNGMFQEGEMSHTRKWKCKDDLLYIKRWNIAVLESIDTY